MLEILVSGILTSPYEHRSIYFTSVSLSLFRFTDPESYIHTLFFGTIDSNTPNKSSGILFQNKIFKKFSISHFFFDSCKPDNFFLVTRKHWRYPQIFVRFAEFLLQFADIHSSIEREWNKKAPESFDTGSREVEIRIAKEGHTLFYFKSLELIIFDTSFHARHVSTSIEIFSDIIS